MMRSILAFGAGWLTILVAPQATMMLLTLGMFLLGLLIGPERLIADEGTDVMWLWRPMALGLSLVQGLAGGWVAARIGRRRGPAVALAIVVVLTPMVASLRTPAPRRAEPTQVDAPVEGGTMPAGARVMGVALPLLELLGLALGARLALRGARPREA